MNALRKSRFVVAGWSVSRRWALFDARELVSTRLLSVVNTSASPDLEGLNAMREDVSFVSGRKRCAAWLYRPEKSETLQRVPLLIMAHGLGGLRGMRLDAYAERFAEAGFASLVFDYRYFGDSEGLPRRLISIRHQKEDYCAAMTYARTLAGIDQSRIVLWGSSFSGGHVLSIAARHAGIAAVVSQCPFTSGLASVGALGLSSVIKVAPLALRDEVSRMRGKAPVRVLLAGRPGTAALMTAPDALEGVYSLYEEGENPLLTVPARIGMRIGFYFPGRSLRNISCPVLLVVCDKDNLAPPRSTLRYARRARNAEVVRYPVGHFDVYRGQPFERSCSDMIAFLRRTVGTTETPDNPHYPAKASAFRRSRSMGGDLSEKS